MFQANVADSDYTILDTSRLRRSSLASRFAAWYSPHPSSLKKNFEHFEKHAKTVEKHLKILKDFETLSNGLLNSVRHTYKHTRHYNKYGVVRKIGN